MTARPITDVETLLAAIVGGFEPRYLFFWGHTAKGSRAGPHMLSQWWPAPFEIGGQVYSSAEQYMMAEKAALFGDETIRAQVLATDNPGKAKALGRSIEGFDEERWRQHRFGIVVRGSTAKFGQNAELKRYLLETGEKVFVEASPMDSIWGIGLAADDERAQHPARWQGLNLLGFALMEARRSIA